MQHKQLCKMLSSSALNMPELKVQICLFCAFAAGPGEAAVDAAALVPN